MTGRNRMTRQPHVYRGGVHRDSRHGLHHGPGPIPVHHPSSLEEELEIRQRELQRIVAENRHLIDANVIIQRELAADKDEIHALSHVIPKIRADGEAQARELIERRIKLEAQLRAVEPLRSDVMQLRAEAQNLNGIRRELTNQIDTLTKDLNHLKSESKQVSALNSHYDELQKELMEARRAHEYEKKANEEQMNQKQAMEKNIISMSREIERLRAEQLNAENKLRLGAGGYGNFNGSSYGDMYGSSSSRAGLYEKYGIDRR
ncbi:protein FLX-like 3 [Impatiens glandulifera]|uniref:protein FLX-like 3 n=1 Tax=Impatiens glandulifera TaxID=253017 RepID=UPI001FB0B3E0|nr:protein FLX-like 3 [Impatiens glandulifera]